MPDQGIDYLPDWSDLAYPRCPECGGPVAIGDLDGLACWACQHCGYRWCEEAEEQREVRYFQ